ncbi:DUF3460 family protein [Massilia sp. DD77]|uniref:DUF3460 family protein n=1 Tax=Massilia sp. DD77 TaxID=3109349 RepID=UPI0030008D10
MIFKKQHSMYESEHTKFIKELKGQLPGMEERQQAGRALLWDKAPLSLDEQARIKESRLRQNAYPYQAKV